MSKQKGRPGRPRNDNDDIPDDPSKVIKIIDDTLKMNETAVSIEVNGLKIVNVYKQPDADWDFTNMRTHDDPPSMWAILTVTTPPVDMPMITKRENS